MDDGFKANDFESQWAALDQKRAELAAAEATLKREKEELAQATLELSRRERAFKNSKLTLHLDGLLTLVPEHSKKNCSDENPHNSWHGECPRCVLLVAKQEGYLDPDIEVELKVRYVGPED